MGRASTRRFLDHPLHRVPGLPPVPVFLFLSLAIGATDTADTAVTFSTSADSTALWLFLTPEAWTSELDEVRRNLPGRIRVESEWLQALSVEVPVDRASELAELPEVLEVRPVRRLGFPGGWETSEPSLTASAGLPPHGARADTVYGELDTPFQLLHIQEAHELGLWGTGTRIGILDGLFWPDHRSLRGRPPVAVRDFVDDDGSVLPEAGDPPGAADHGTALWSLVSGDWPGALTGVSPEAGVILARVRDEGDPVGADEDRWVEGLEWLETQGARVVLSGVGFRNFEGGVYGPDDLDGDTAPATRAADEAARRGVLVVAPVGNGGPGPGTLASPADGDSVLAVGAVNLTGQTSSFSAEGPTADGRPKPELRAPGESFLAASTSDPEGLEPVQGTEFSAALLAGSAALFVEAYPERGPLDILQALTGSATALDGAEARIPKLGPAILFPDGVQAFPSQDVGSGGRVTTLVPQFQWNVPTTHPLGLPVTFILEFADDSMFSQLLLVDSVLGVFARRIQEPLPPSTFVYWRVKARSGQGIEWVTPPQGPLEVPAWVSLDVLNDPGGTQVADPQPEFRWTPMTLPPPAGPFTFELQVFSDREGEVVQSYGGLEESHFRIEEPLPFNVPFRWSVIAQARNGTADTVSSAAPFVVTGGARPPVTILYQNFPNPFPDPDEGLEETRIWFDLAEESRVELAVYDMRGRLVRSLIPARGCGATSLPPGLYGRGGELSTDPCVSFSWDGRDEGGGHVSPGVYLLRLRAGGVVEIRRIVFWP